MPSGSPSPGCVLTPSSAQKQAKYSRRSSDAVGKKGHPFWGLTLKFSGIGTLPKRNRKKGPTRQLGCGYLQDQLEFYSNPVYTPIA